MKIRLASTAAFLLVSAPLLLAPAYAAGGGGDPVPTCKEGQVYDKKTKKCVDQQGMGAIDDDSLYATGRQLALAGRYGEAITVLSLVENKADPRVLNYLGYAHRKQGRVLVGLGYYQEALRVDPDYTLVREYLGEAHLQLGDVASAREQLGEIEKRCGKGCEEYAELSAQIDAYLKARG
ncbi:MAG: tetratricopeptide repeat protein [Pseudaminobacter sp.]|nr:tetratricopeptide repeat protein [Pseudaminobacter sp.]